MKRRWMGVVMVMALSVMACSASVAENAEGRQIYLALCARCHGEGLEGLVGPPLGPDSNAAIRPDEFLVFTIENGRGRMPSFKSVLDDDQVDRLVAYVREVQEG